MSPIRSSASAWSATLFLAAAATLNYADRAALSAIVPELKRDLGLSDVAIGLMGSLFLWSYALASPVAGQLADRFSRRTLVIGSLLLWSITTALTGSAVGFATLGVLRIALGLTECLYLPAAIALVADLHHRETRARAMSLLLLGQSSGIVLGGLFAGYMADHYGWRAGFYILGFAGILLAAGGRFFLGREVRKPTNVVVPAISWGKALRYLTRTPSYLLLLAKTMFAGVALWIFYAWLPLYFYENYGLGLAAAGFAGTFMLQAFAAAGIGLGGWVSDALAKQAPRNRMLMQAVCYALAAPFLLTFIGRPELWVINAAIAAFSLFRGLAGVSEQPCLCDIVPTRYRSTAIGIMNTGATAAGGVGVLLAGFLKAHWGLGTVFALTSIGFLLAAVGLFVGYALFITRDIARAHAEETAA